ncbi:hCG1776376, isoform CRA_c [Homo sapiens]|nr:hCG1776376, isoform CRA_c [Homo sapiens]
MPSGWSSGLIQTRTPGPARARLLCFQEHGWVVLLPGRPSSWGRSLADPPSSSQALHSPARQVHLVWLLRSRGFREIKERAQGPGASPWGRWDWSPSPRFAARLSTSSPFPQGRAQRPQRGGVDLPATPGGPRGQCAGRSGDVLRRAGRRRARPPPVPRLPAPRAPRRPRGPATPDPSPPAGRPHGPAGRAAPGRRPGCTAQLRAPGRRGRQRLLVHPGGGGRRQWQRLARARRAALLALGALAHLRRCPDTGGGQHLHQLLAPGLCGDGAAVWPAAHAGRPRQLRLVHGPGLGLLCLGGIQRNPPALSCLDPQPEPPNLWSSESPAGGRERGRLRPRAAEGPTQIAWRQRDAVSGQGLPGLCSVHSPRRAGLVEKRLMRGPESPSDLQGWGARS